ncbi:MAG: hypothetical protein GX986_04815 [Firmicutes bacterium]|nr:hypothetical protein [Bacillota bacterium]
MWKLWVAMLLMAAVEIPILVRAKLWGELWVFLGLWTTAGVFASLVAARTVLPSIVLVIYKIFALNL